MKSSLTFISTRSSSQRRAAYNDKVIAARTDSLDPFYRRALAAVALEDFSAAISDLEKVVTKDPKYDFIGPQACWRLRTVAWGTRRAEALFKQATELSTLSETYYNYAAFLSASGRAAEGREWAERILAKKPTMPRYLRRRERPWFRKASALLKQIPAS